MDVLEKYYGRVSFTLFGLFMAVPGSNACCRQVFLTLCVLLLTLGTVFQLLKFVIDGLTLKLIVQLLPTVASMVGSLLYVFYLTFAARGRLEKILSAMQKDLREERTAKENEIKRQFALNARFFTNLYTGVLIMTSCGMPLAGFLPQILDILTFANTTRQPELFFNGEIFIDQRKYFYYIYFAEGFTSAVVGILVVISENISIIIGQHVCGMFAVVGHRLENIIEEGEEETWNKANCRGLLARRLKLCIRSHQSSVQSVPSRIRLMRFAVIAIEFYDIPLTIILSGCFCTLTMSLVQVTDPQLVSMNMVVFTCAQFCQLFLMSYIGQVGIDASLRIAQNAYNAKWENLPTNLRKLVYMIILRSGKPCQVTARGIYVLSIENCMAVVQTIMSFYMVIRQSR